MNQSFLRKYLVIGLFLCVTLIPLITTEAQQIFESAPKNFKYVDYGQIKLNQLAGGNKVHECNIDTLGYKEIRVFVNVFVENYQKTPIQNAKLKMRFFHNTISGSWFYQETIVHSKYTSYIEGYADKQLMGKSLRLLIEADNLPAGPYTVTLTYYLVH